MNLYEWTQCMSVSGGEVSGVPAMPFTQENTILSVAWAVAEGSHALWNPWDTTEPEPADTDYNALGVKNYPNWMEGIQATWRTLHNGLYVPILNALKAGDSAATTMFAVGNSEWGTGFFPTELAAVRANPCAYYGRQVAGTLP